MKQYLNIPFKHIAGHDLCADFYIPEDVINPPVILWIHGGGWKDLNRKWCLVKPQLERGYAILFDPAQEKPVTSAANVAAGTRLVARLADGSLNVTVDRPGSVPPPPFAAV